MDKQTQQRTQLLRDMGAMIAGQLSHPAICGNTPFELHKDGDGYAYRGVAGYRVAQILLNVGLRNRELANALTQTAWPSSCPGRPTRRRWPTLTLRQ